MAWCRLRPCQIFSNQEIAARLHLSPRTVEKHVENLLRLTAAQSRTELVVLAGPEKD
jgi:DNA-binding NarL/FixJ family response regulator